MKKSKFLKSDLLKTAALSLLYISSIAIIGATVNPPKKVILFSILLFFLATAVLYYAVKKKWGLDKIFLIIAIPLGLLYLFSIPIGRVADEPEHYYRAYDISQGKFISDSNEDGGGAELSVKFQEVLRKENVSYSDYSSRVSVSASEEDEKKFMYYGNTAIYFFTCYLPQAIGIAIGNLFHSPILVGAYLGRLMNLAFFIIVVFFSIKKIPILKSAVFFVSLLPMTIHQAASLSSDVVTYTTAVGLFAFVLYQIYDKTKARLKVKDYIIMIALCIFVGMCKYAYLPLCLLILLIPPEKFGTKKRKYVTIGVLATAVVIMNIAWFFLAGDLMHLPGGQDVALQSQYVLHHPHRFIVAVGKTIFSKGWPLIGTALGASLEWFDIGISELLVLAIVIISCLFVKRYKSITILPQLKHMTTFVFFVITAAFIIIEYLTWTPVGANYVDGIQGRYFLPLLFMVPLLFTKTSTKQSTLRASLNDAQKIDNGLSLAMLQFLVAINVIAVQTIIIHHLPL